MKKFSFLLFFLAGCDSTYSPLELESDSGIEEKEISMVDLYLSAGNLGSDFYFDEVEMPIETQPNGSVFPIQVGAFIENLEEYETDFLRVHFSSDFKEWIGQSSRVYLDEDECKSQEVHCDSVDFANGVSGHFEIQDDFISIQNVYCRHSQTSYSYTVTAVAVDISYWPEEEISEPAHIEIVCKSR